MMKRILIINNDLDTMKLLKEWLEHKKYHATFTADPTKVKAILNEFNPHLIIVDIMRKDVIPIIKDHRSSLPLILMTGYAKIEPINDLPVDEIVEKPFNLPILEMKINKLLHTA